MHLKAYCSGTENIDINRSMFRVRLKTYQTDWEIENHSSSFISTNEEHDYDSKIIIKIIWAKYKHAERTSWGHKNLKQQKLSCIIKCRPETSDIKLPQIPNKRRHVWPKQQVGKIYKDIRKVCHQC